MTKTLIWSDEFDGTELNSSNWGFEYGFKRGMEMQYYTDSKKNVRVEDGRLIIQANREVVPNKDYIPGSESWHTKREYAYYTSGCVITHKKHSWLYKRIEVRAKIPTGRGTWPAIWLLGENIDEVSWPACGEIDIMESVGFEKHRAYCTTHKPDRYSELNNTFAGIIEDVNLESEYHTYAVEWDDQEVRFYYDDDNTPYHTQQRNGELWPFDKPMYLLLNLAIGGGWGGQHGIDNTIFPQQYLIDWVRVYDISK